MLIVSLFLCVKAASKVYTIFLAFCNPAGSGGKQDFFV